MKIKEYEKNNLKFIELNNGIISLTLCNLAASIYSIYFGSKLVTMTPLNIEDFSGTIYHGKTVGRTANRIKGNVIEIDGKKYALKNNEGVNTLHGGIDGISTKIFEYKIVKTTSQTKVEFKYTSQDMESGFPGALKIKISYVIFEKSPKFSIKFDAKTNKPTLCNLTNHTFFTMGENSLNNVMLKLNASKYLKCNSIDLIPLMKNKVNSALDFRNFKIITKDIEKVRFGKANGYDHNFYLSGIKNKPQIFLKTNNLLLKIKTDFECCQIYSDNYLSDNVKWVGLDDRTNRAIALEPQDDFLKRKILRPGEKYSRFIAYEFKTTKSKQVN